MEREVLMEKTIRKIKRLPTTRVREVNDFVEFVIQRTDDALITEGLQQLSSNSHINDFLNNEPELYSVNDLKVKFVWKKEVQMENRLWYFRFPYRKQRFESTISDSYRKNCNDWFWVGTWRIGRIVQCWNCGTWQRLKKIVSIVVKTAEYTRNTNTQLAVYLRWDRLRHTL